MFGLRVLALAHHNLCDLWPLKPLPSDPHGLHRATITTTYFALNLKASSIIGVFTTMYLIARRFPHEHQDGTCASFIQYFTALALYRLAVYIASPFLSP
jgi:hypothetical protein